MTSSLARVLLLPLALAGCQAAGLPSSPSQGAEATRTTDGSNVPTNHRAAGNMCPTARAPNQTSSPWNASTNALDCTVDSDCTDGTNGRCGEYAGDSAFYQCSYDQCFQDSDCTTGGPCGCRGSSACSDPNVCFAGNCKVDADCGQDGYCSPSLIDNSNACSVSGQPLLCFCGPGASGGSCATAGYYCHTKTDKCVNDSDCSNGGSTAGYVCAYRLDGYWDCEQPLCI